MLPLRGFRSGVFAGRFSGVVSVFRLFGGPSCGCDTPGFCCFRSFSGCFRLCFPGRWWCRVGVSYVFSGVRDTPVEPLRRNVSGGARAGPVCVDGRNRVD